MSKPALVVDGVTKSYGGFKAVDDVSLSVNQGDMLALLGHNGAGKTTLFKLALGLIKPTSGNITLAGDKSNIGYLPENISFYDQMSAQETLSYYALKIYRAILRVLIPDKSKAIAMYLAQLPLL